MCISMYAASHCILENRESDALSAYISTPSGAKICVCPIPPKLIGVSSQLIIIISLSVRACI